MDVEPTVELLPKQFAPLRQITLLILRDGLACHWCKELCDPWLHPFEALYPTRDHVIRRADGGTSVMENLVVACRKCNNERHAWNWKPG